MLTDNYRLATDLEDLFHIPYSYLRKHITQSYRIILQPCHRHDAHTQPNGYADAVCITSITMTQEAAMSKSRTESLRRGHRTTESIQRWLRFRFDTFC